jgi:ribosomal protein L37AE/L43A
MGDFELLLKYPKLALLTWLVFSVVMWLFWYQNEVARWLNERKLEAWHQERRKCPVCGKRMFAAVTKAESKKVWCCSNWQKCKTYIEHHTGERLSAAEIERTDGKAAL